MNSSFWRHASDCAGEACTGSRRGSSVDALDNMLGPLRLSLAGNLKVGLACRCGLGDLDGLGKSARWPGMEDVVALPRDDGSWLAVRAASVTPRRKFMNMRVLVEV